jgi:hypothetical protein
MCVMSAHNGTPCPNPAVGGGDYCWTHGDWFQADLDIYKMVDEHFRQDLRDYWRRSDSYVVVEALLISVFTSLLATNRSTLVLLTLGVFGSSLTVVWFLVMRGSLAWIRSWRRQRARISLKLDRYGYHAELEREVRKNPLRSPTTLSSYVPLLVLITWVALIATLFWG